LKALSECGAHIATKPSEIAEIVWRVLRR
jgi:hypothetical protein